VATETNTRALVVEDDPASARLMELLLRQIGCAATVAPNGDAAMRLIQTVPFSLVFLDYDLPGLSGPEIIRRVRALPDAAARVPIVVLSGYADLEKKSQCLNAGADEYLIKPIAVAQLQQTLRRFCSPPAHVENTTVVDAHVDSGVRDSSF
jgi:CheY-like chemotaxis protein